jgi:hypothetical protein
MNGLSLHGLSSLALGSETSVFGVTVLIMEYGK